MPFSVTLGTDSETGSKITLGDIERRSGLYILGIPGMGKSVLMVNLMLQDREHGNGFFFLDPHGDAITDLTKRIDLPRSVLDSLSDSLLLLDPKNDTYSFGINPLACRDILRMSEREDTYKRAYNIFSTLWEGDTYFGPWLQLILQNTLRAFIDNPEFTLAEMPLFLHPHNSAFRNYIVSNIRHYPTVADFWRYEFSARREREQQERMDAVLTRVNTLLTDPYVHDIVGQKTTTINFAELIEKRAIILVNLPANLATDSRRFIGALLISELVHAVRNRPEDKRHQFGIFVDEFQNFASAEDDFSTLITEARKFGVATTIAHQERYGQFADNKKLLGATAAAANKVFFQLTVKDAQELAPEFASLVEATEKRREAELVISPRPIEDIWERGHTDDYVMYIRNKYFWIVELLRNKPNEKYFVFDPSRTAPEYMKRNPVNFQVQDFADWEWYRSSADMLRQGISLLNQYYYDWMGNKYDPNKAISDAQLQLMLKVIECLGGVFGFLPTMQPYISEEKRARLVYLMNEKLKQNYEQEKREKIQAAKDEIEYLKIYGIHINNVTETRYVRGEPTAFVTDTVYWKGESIVLDKRYWDRRQMVTYKDYDAQLRHIKDLWERIRTLEQSQPPMYPNMLRSVFSPRDMKEIHAIALQAGMPMHEVESLIEWEAHPLEREEKTALADMVTMFVNMDIDPQYGRDSERISRHYFGVLSKRLGASEDSSEKADKRQVWQFRELGFFIALCLQLAPHTLAKEPVKIPSGKYDETLTVERMQQDLVNEKAIELSRLPRFTAYAKVIQERDSEQVVLSRRITTAPPRLLSQGRYAHEYSQPVRTIIEQNTTRSWYCKARGAILEEIRERQERWRRGPGGEPPPTNTGGTTPPSIPPGRAGSERVPPPTHYISIMQPEGNPPESAAVLLPKESADMSTENRWEEERDITPRAVEDIWGRGYEDRYVMHVREKYFWIVELLRNKPNEKYFVFDPARHVPLLDGVNPGQLNWNTFDDWDMYRSSSDMIRQGIALLNKYYYNSMQKKYSYDVPVSDADLQEILKIIDCFGGVFGLRPAMQPYISDEWEIRPMERRGKETLTALVRNIRDSLVLVRRNEAQWRKDHNDCLSEYDTVMSVYTLGEKFGKRTLMDDWSYEMRSYVLKASERVHWQMTELTQFITLVLSYTGSQLEKRPILNYRN